MGDLIPYRSRAELEAERRTREQQERARRILAEQARRAWAMNICEKPEGH